MQKHAVTIRGHRTSISLEAEFWNELKAIAARDGKPLAALIAEIDAARGMQGHPAEGRPIGLSSAIRVYVLGLLKTR